MAPVPWLCGLANRPRDCVHIQQTWWPSPAAKVNPELTSAVAIITGHGQSWSVQDTGLWLLFWRQAGKPRKETHYNS